MTRRDDHRRRADARAGRVLGAGVATSAACLATGLALWLAGAAPEAADRLLLGGLVLLMVTPTLRVAVAVVEALRARDWLLASSSAAVLLVLAATALAAFFAR